jgi:Right handed beta helix region
MTPEQSVHGVAVQIADTTQTVVENIKTSGGNGRAAVAFDRTTNAVLRRSEIMDWQHWFNAGQEEEALGVSVTTNSAGILIKDNDSESHSGDSFQCQHPATGQPPTNITISGNRYRKDEENAIDIKTCKNVTVTGNSFWGYRPVDQGSNQSRFGDAIAVHVDADQIMIENNDIWDSGRAVSVGASGGPGAGSTGVGLVVIRRNEIHEMYQDTSLPSPLQALGAGVRISPAKQIEIYHNTFRFLPGYAIRLGDDGKIQRAVVVNNLVTLAGSSLEMFTGNLADFASDYNLFASDRFLVDGQTLTLQDWVNQRPGHDVNSFVADPHIISNSRESGGTYTLPWSPARDVAGRIGDQLGGPFCFDGPDIGAKETCFYFDNSPPTIDFDLLDETLQPIDTTKPITGQPKIYLSAKTEDLEVGIKSLTISGDITRYCMTADGRFGQSAIIQSWNEVTPAVKKGDYPPIDRLRLLLIDLGTLPHGCSPPFQFVALICKFAADGENFEKRTATAQVAFRNE